MPTPPESLDTLRPALGSTSTTEVLHASWEAFDLALRVADAVTWLDGVDELRALAAARACAGGRALLPLPRDGRPLPLPRQPAASTRACADVLRDVHRSLTALARARPAPDPDGDALLEAAALAEDAATAFDGLAVV
ncbi:hypothetical protein [Streptomyces marincola]|uniref:Uncharacterized protein n=1 Tax=Streptomyces marincola TaxID=2878388 RepID=A0A1W7CWM7_9ACTN|nr:hypothetical protein [Streptomyces marincola]ARQ69182.1 hypothetical protein CAG99_10185 [Streptomyces marincola]